MPSVVIDTNPLAYVYNGTPGFGKKYAILLGDLAKRNVLVVPEIVYGELSLIFASERELDTFLSDTGIVVGQIPRTTYVVAAKRWEEYNKRRVLICHRCGRKLPKLTCEQCRSALKIRQHVLSDFLIGAYALEMQGRKIVTSDAGYYASYFPELDVVTSE
jgi:predicted nucleic acid-binding protein